MRHLRKVATQCRSDYVVVQCITSYYVKVSSAAAGDDFTAVCGADNCPQLFTGNDPSRDWDDVVANEFDWPVAARFVRLNPQSWFYHMSTRWEIYGCDDVY